MTGEDDRHAGSWNSSSKVIRSGMQDGPVVVFNSTQRGEGDILVLSPFSHFMATSLTQRNNLPNSILEYGVMGSMSSIPANSMHLMIVFYSPHGINEGVHEWCQTTHNRFWAYDTVYKQNYSFVLDEINGKSLPIGNDSF